MVFKETQVYLAVGVVLLCRHMDFHTEMALPIKFLKLT